MSCFVLKLPNKNKVLSIVKESKKMWVHGSYQQGMGRFTLYLLQEIRRQVLYLRLRFLRKFQ